MNSDFIKLFNTDVSEHVDKRKQGKTELNYLSWAWAWAEVSKLDAEATYKAVMFQDKEGLLKPYIYDPILGYMVMTEMTIFGKTKSMWLPVMDGANKAMLDHSYEYRTKYETKKVEAATMFDINKTLMRCLVKNIAMFGLGLKIYAGEDLPNIAEDSVIEAKVIPDEDKARINNTKDIEKLREACRYVLDKLGAEYSDSITELYRIKEEEISKSQKQSK